MPLHAMPFRLLEFQIRFFTASYVNTASLTTCSVFRSSISWKEVSWCFVLITCIFQAETMKCFFLNDIIMLHWHIGAPPDYITCMDIQFGLPLLCSSGPIFQVSEPESMRAELTGTQSTGSTAAWTWMDWLLEGGCCNIQSGHFSIPAVRTRTANKRIPPMPIFSTEPTKWLYMYIFCT